MLFWRRRAETEMSLAKVREVLEEMARLAASVSDRENQRKARELSALMRRETNPGAIRSRLESSQRLVESLDDEAASLEESLVLLRAAEGYLAAGASGEPQGTAAEGLDLLGGRAFGINNDQQLLLARDEIGRHERLLQANTTRRIEPEFLLRKADLEEEMRGILREMESGKPPGERIAKCLQELSELDQLQEKLQPLLRQEAQRRSQGPGIGDPRSGFPT